MNHEVTLTPQKNRQGLALGLLLLLGVIWGSGYSIAKLAMQNGVAPLGYSFWQSIGPAILVTIAALFYDLRLHLNREHLIYYFICGLVGLTIPNTTMYFVAPHIPAGILGVVVNTVPVITYFIALCVGQEKFNWARFIGVMIAMLGILLIIIPKASLPTETMVPWVLAALIAPIGFALCIIYIAQRKMDGSVLSHSAGMLFSSSLLLIPLVFSTHQFYPLHPPLHLAGWLIILEIILSSVGYILLFELLKIANPVFYSLVSGVVALTGLTWGYIIFGEKPTSSVVFAVAFILFGILLVTIFPRNRSSK